MLSHMLPKWMKINLNFKFISHLILIFMGKWIMNEKSEFNFLKQNTTLTYDCKMTHKNDFLYSNFDQPIVYSTSFYTQVMILLPQEPIWTHLLSCTTQKNDMLTRKKNLLKKLFYAFIHVLRGMMTFMLHLI
jgi:hypothetical protein